MTFTFIMAAKVCLVAGGCPPQEQALVPLFCSLCVLCVLCGLIAEEFCRAPCSVSRPTCPLTPRRFWGDYSEQFDVRNFQQMARGNKLESARLYADRVAGCCCHHCHFGLVAASCF